MSRKYNLGNYQTLDLQLEADLEPSEDAKETMSTLEQMINDYYQCRTPNLVSLVPTKKEVSSWLLKRMLASLCMCVAVAVTAGTASSSEDAQNVEASNPAEKERITQNDCSNRRAQRRTRQSPRPPMHDQNDTTLPPTIQTRRNQNRDENLVPKNHALLAVNLRK